MRHLSEHIKIAAYNLGIRFPTPLPLFQGTPNKDYLLAWAESQSTPMARQIAHKVRENLQYIPFEAFLSQLQQTIDDFHQRVETAPYVLLVGELRSDKLEAGCSDLWVIGLALEHCGLREPAAILTPEQFLLYRATHPTINKVLMLDDASYSGTQKWDILNYLVTKEEIRAEELSFYVGIPFMTKYAEKQLLPQGEWFKELSSKCKWFRELFFLNHAYMPSVVDVLDAKEVFYAKSVKIPYVNCSQTITYFDHRFADFFSCFQQVYEGTNLLNHELFYMMQFQGYTYEPERAQKNKNLQLITEPKKYNDLAYSVVPTDNVNCSGYNIPIIIPPYSLKKVEVRKQLSRAINHGKMGVRTSNPTVEPDVEALISISNPQSVRFFEYKKSTWPLEKQSAFDNAVMCRNQREITWEEQKDIHKKRQQLHHELKTAFPLLRKTKSQHSPLHAFFSALAQFLNLLLIITGLRFLLSRIQNALYPDSANEFNNTSPAP